MSIDFSPLSGDPTLTFDELEWADDMMTILDTATPERQRVIFRDMTTDEADMVIAAYARKGKAS